MSFQTHGQYSIKIEDNIIIVDAEGPFNDELINAYQADYRSAMSQVCEKYKTWSQIIYLYHDSLLTPEAEEELTKLNVAKNAQGLTHGAVIFVDTEGSNLLATQFQRIYDKAGITVVFTTDLGDAKMWLKNQTQIEFK